MSGGNCPETPRQKMIGMMYLFLTAMLAVNVSSTVLDGFKLVDEGLRSNNEIFSKNNNAFYSNFKSEYDKNNVKFGPAYDKARELRAAADALYNSIDSIKWLLARKTDGEEGNPYNLKGSDNVDVSSAVMLFKLNPQTPTRARVLKNEINAYLDFLLNDVVVNTEKFPEITEALKKTLNTEDIKRPDHSHDSGPLTWEQSLFDNIPIGAIMPLLTKLQTDVRNTESMALTHLFSQVTASEFKVNDIQAHLIPSSTYLVRGSRLQASLLLAATDSTKKPDYELFVDGNPITGDDDGQFEILCNQKGMYEITGRIITEDEDGNPNIHAIKPISYEVVDPFATVSATMMNVMYAGVENPLSISVPGFSARDIKVRISDGSAIVPNGDAYIATPKSPGKNVDVIVSALVEGELTQIGTYPFRIKSLPPPTAFVQYPKKVKNASGQTITMPENFSNGRLRRSDLLNAYGIVADLLGSAFEVKYDVVGFDMVFYDTMRNASTLKSTSSKFTAEQKTRIKQLARGKQFFISNIRAVGPDGIVRRLPPIDITLM